MANEKRLIDVYEALEELRKAEPKLYFVDMLGFKAVDISAFIKFLENRKTVDAVEVVRCKDCKHYGWEQEPSHGRTQRFCKLHKGLVVVDRDTFCSYGERKDNV